VRTLGLDVHRRFAEVAVHAEGESTRIGRVELEDFAVFAESLGPDDHVVIESTAVTWALVEMVSRHAGKVTVSNPMKTKMIASAKVKTDKVDARVLSELGASGFVSEVWVPDAATRSLRRRVAHRARLVRTRARFRNQAHAILIRNLASVSATDAFGKRGRRQLAEVRLPVDEREQLDSTLRLHDAIDAELVEVERGLSREALDSPGVRRLITIPGIGAVTALGLVALVGDVERFPTPRHLVSYLGLDPRVRQSGDRPARMGHISRQGQAHARSLLIEAATAAIKTPGPLRAFHARIRSRRSSQVATVATARKLAVLIWHLLTNDEDYRHEAPTVTRRKLRELEKSAGNTGQLTSLVGDTAHKKVERRLLEQAERLYSREVALRNRP
jgi:transposase